MARSDPANAPRALTSVPMMLHNTPAGPHPANRIRPYHGGMGDPSLLTDTRQLPSQSYPRTYTRQSVSNLLLLQRALTPPGCRTQTAIMPLVTPLPAALRRTHTSSIHTGKWPSPHQAPAALSLPPLTLTDRPSYSCRPNQHSRSAAFLPPSRTAWVRKPVYLCGRTSSLLFFMGRFMPSN